MYILYQGCNILIYQKLAKHPDNMNIMLLNKVKGSTTCIRIYMACLYYIADFSFAGLQPINIWLIGRRTFML